MKNIDPRKYNLSPRIRLQQKSINDLFIVIDRKSRIIMKDGYRIVEIVNSIQSAEKNSAVSVLTSAPVCSKTRQFLSERKIEIKEL
ncbi:MAG TPA: hypothetical protein EYO16_00585 [Candidatus Marinimicrobia bacterium]|nr:hypothetical protein [Candidatus Neomarinimicrobiota bacterium]